MAANVIHPGTLPLEGWFLRVSEGASVVAAKTAEEREADIVIRLVNLLAEPNPIRVSLAKAPASVTLVSPTEKEIAVIPSDPDGFTHRFRPGELLSFRVTF